MFLRSSLCLLPSFSRIKSQSIGNKVKSFNFSAFLCAAHERESAEFFTSKSSFICSRRISNSVLSIRMIPSLVIRFVVFFTFFIIARKIEIRNPFCPFGRQKRSLCWCDWRDFFAGAHRRLPLALRTARTRLPTKPLTVKRRTASFYGRSSNPSRLFRPQKSHPQGGGFSVVRLAGFEPARFPRRILSPLCMPFHHNRIDTIVHAFLRLSTAKARGSRRSHRPQE